MRCQHPLSSSCTSEHCIPDQACPLHGCSPSSPSHTSGYRLSCCCRLLQSSHQLKPAKQMSACLMPMLTINPGSVCHRLKQQLSQHLLPDQQLILPQQACFSLPKVSSKWSLWRLPALRLPGWTYLQLKGRDQPALCQHPPGDLCRSACQQKDVNGAKMPWHTKAAAVRHSSTHKPRCKSDGLIITLCSSLTHCLFAGHGTVLLLQLPDQLMHHSYGGLPALFRQSHLSMGGRSRLASGPD